MKKVLIISFSMILTMVFINSCKVESHNKRVLLIYSYHPDYSWVIEETDGINEVLQGEDLEITKFYMDTKRNTGREWFKMISDSALRVIDRFEPDIIIVLDDNACEFVMENQPGIKVPVVFCGMNNDPSDYGFPTVSITGVIERYPFDSMVDFLLELKPDIKKVAFVSDDSRTSHGIAGRITKFNLPVTVHEIFSTNDFNKWKEKIIELQDEVDAIGIFTYHTLKDSIHEESIPPEEVLSWILENSNLPEFTTFDFAVQQGALCGLYISGLYQGKYAAQIALKILKGGAPDQMGILTPTEGFRLININRAIDLGIEIPEDIECEIIE